MDSSNSLVLNFAFPCGLRGFHVYKELWNPKLNEKLETIHEENNPHDRYAVAAIRKTVSRLRPVVVGHLPREISMFTRFIILHGATVKVKVSDTKYRRSPLIQGGLEIPVEVEVQMENSSENQQALSKYQTLVAENYVVCLCWEMFCLIYDILWCLLFLSCSITLSQYLSMPNIKRVKKNKYASLFLFSP